MGAGMDTTATSSDIDDTFQLDSVVRGYHVYKDIWTTIYGEELQRAHKVKTCKIYTLLAL